MYSIEDILNDMELEQLVNLYEIVQDNNNDDNKKLLALYNNERYRIYGEGDGDLTFLDFAQMGYLRKTIEQIILYKV